MTQANLFDQELVVHVFAPVDGPNAVQAHGEISEIWRRCRDILGMTERISNTGLQTAPPRDLGQTPPDQAFAGCEDRAADYQAILRRVHDVVNLSMVMAAPLDTVTRRQRIGSALPPGWIEFHRWWHELSADVTGAQLGAVIVFQAKRRRNVPTAQAAQLVRAAMPGLDEKPYWWEHSQVSPDGFDFWELSPDDERPTRHLAVVAPDDQDARLSAWTWSRGDVELPPLARYLMHAAKLRYQARVRGSGQPFNALLHRANDRVARVAGLVGASPGRSIERDEWHGLRADQAELTASIAAVRAMSRTVRIAVDNMVNALAEPLGTDRRLAQWLPVQLEDDAEYLATAHQAIHDLRQSLGDHHDSPNQPFVPLPTVSGLLADSVDARGEVARGRTSRIELRMGFGVDVVGYSSRTAPDKDLAQQRLRTLVQEVLAELDIRVEETDHQGTGDGMNVFLPVSVELHRALPRVLHAWDQQLAFDNRKYTDRLRLRLSMTVGPVGIAAIGFSGGTIVEMARLLNSDRLRQAMSDHPDADLAALLSDELHRYVVGEGHPGLDRNRFTEVEVEQKEFRRRAWLWVSNLREPKGGTS